MLRINSIYIKNFGNIIEETVKLTNQITVFSGENGQGKSTFLKAVYLNLYDHYEGTYGDYVRWGQTGFINILEFTLFGKKCKSEVIVNKNSASRTLSIGNDTYAGSDAKKVLEELLPSKITMAASVSMENQIDIIKTSPAQRREFLKNLYDLNFKDEIDALKAGYDDNDTALKNAQNEVTTLENKEYVYPEMPEVALSDDEVEVLEEKENKLQTKISEYESKKEAYDAKVETFKTLKSSRKVLDDSISTVSDRHDTIFDSIKANEAVIKSEFDPEPSLVMYAKKKVELSRNLKELTDSPIKRPQRLIGKRSPDKLNSLVAEDARLKAFKSSLVDKIELMKSGKCSECGAPYDAGDTAEKIDQVKSCEVKLLELFDAVAEETTEFEANEFKREAQEKLISKADIYDNNVKNYQDQLSENETSRETRKLELETDYNKNIAFAEENLKLLKTSHKETEVKMKDLDKQVKAIEKNIQDNFAVIELPEELDDGIDQELLFCVEALETHSNILESIRTVTKVIDDLDDQKAVDVKELKKKRKVRDKYQVEVNEYDEALNVLKTGLPQFILVKLTKALEDLSNYFLENTYDGRYKLRFIPSKTSLSLVYGAKETIVKLASGYEQQVFSLAFKVALANSGVDTKLLMLDEADSASSEENSEKLFQFLGSLLGKFFEQYIIVTHKPKIKELLENEFKADILLVEDGKIKND